METKEEKKERRQGYFARLKKKRQAKQNAETVSANSPGSPVSKTPAEKDDGSKVILDQISSSEDNCKFSREKETAPDKEKKKKKYNQLKDIRRTELKRYYSTGDVQLWGEKLLAKRRDVVLSAAGGWHRRAGEKEFSILQEGGLQHPSPQPGLFCTACLLAPWWHRYK